MIQSIAPPESTQTALPGEDFQKFISTYVCLSFKLLICVRVTSGIKQSGPDVLFPRSLAPALLRESKGASRSAEAVMSPAMLLPGGLVTKMETFLGA